MALIDLWKRSREELAGKRLAQIIGLAGSGKLRDDNDASQEFRHLLSNVPTDLLVEYADQCLSDKFDDSGLALQDIVNQLGKRLGFSTTEGRYRGTTSQIGFDGIWRSPEAHSLIVEVKTTDAYRIDLNVIAGYRRALIAEDKVSEEESSMLIVVGRQDTGDLEAQIRGSKHAWDVRLISLDALCRLVKLKEKLEDPATVGKVYDVLMPREFTKVDGIIDLVFSTTEEAREETEPLEDEEEGPQFVPVNFHEACARRIEKSLGVSLIRLTKASFTNSEAAITVVCAVSREYTTQRGPGYWFAFHPHQRALLAKAAKPYVAFGCASAETLLLIPFGQFDSWISGFNTTTTDDGRMYWHVHLRRESKGMLLNRKKGFDRIDVSSYLI